MYGLNSVLLPFAVASSCQEVVSEIVRQRKQGIWRCVEENSEMMHGDQIAASRFGGDVFGIDSLRYRGMDGSIRMFRREGDCHVTRAESSAHGHLRGLGVAAGCTTMELRVQA